MKRNPTCFLFRLALPAALLCLAIPREVEAQGCMAVRSVGSPALASATSFDSHHAWQASLSYRYLYADRYFQGSKELSDVAGMSPGDRDINEIHTFDVALSYTFDARLTLTLDLPVIYAERTSHFGPPNNVQSFTTRASGIGDMRLTADYWLLNPEKHAKGNVALGLGVKAPTGSYDVKDDVPQPGGVVRRAVDSAIQPGDGGWGVILQGQAYQQIVSHLTAYANGQYLINPREVNGTRSFSPLNSPNHDDVNSVPDQYVARAGLSFTVWPKAGLSLSLGGRVEGIPVNDLVGGDEGFRRPGYIISIEPGLNWAYGRHNFAVTAPVALERNRQRSESDKEIPGRMYVASFADWTLFASYSFRF